MTRALAATLFAALVLIPAAGTHGIKEGGTFRIAFLTGALTAIDPALVDIPAESQLLAPTCGTLLAYPHKPPPAGFRLAPRLAEDEPVISRDGKTYTFIIRKHAFFSNGQAVTARAFERALERVRDPVMESRLELDFQDVRKVIATGRTLRLRLTRPRPPGLLDAMTFLCAVTPNLPVDPEAARAPLHGAGPYYVAQYVPGERLVLERNRFYRGERPHHVDRITANLAASPGTAVDQVKNGTFDYVLPAINAVAPEAEDLAARYGKNESQFWVRAGAGVRVFYLNTSMPLFHKNPELRRAVNFAVDRKRIAREGGLYAETATDQFLLPNTPGYVDERIYPRKGPNLKKARELARGRTRSGKAVLYTGATSVDIPQAQILKENLGKIGIELEIRNVPDLFDKLATPGEPFDLGRVRVFTTPDPSLLHAFDGRTIGELGTANYSHFNSVKINRLLDEASQLVGDARYRAYAELDVLLARDYAPAIPISVVNALAFVSKRTGCIVMNPSLDLTAVCLK